MFVLDKLINNLFSVDLQIVAALIYSVLEHCPIVMCNPCNLNGYDANIYHLREESTVASNKCASLSCTAAQYGGHKTA